jgi:predicted lipid-binding transport protein (Tim44 family)
MAPSFAQDQKAQPETPQAEQGMKGGMMGGMMGGDMMTRMNKMMDQCEKMMSERSMHRGMRHRDRS